MTKNTPIYDESSISILKGQEAVRTRPAMYIGDTGKKGLHHLVWEILDNSVDEAMGGFCTQINITVAEDGHTVTIEDDGRGIPVAPKQEDPKKRSTLEIVLTELHAGGKFGGSGYESSGGLHGVGASCVNFLSRNLTAKVWRDGGAFELSFERGIATTPCNRISDSRKHGTSIVFVPDHNMFGQVNIEDVFTNVLGEEFEIDEELADAVGVWKKLLIAGPVDAEVFVKTFEHLTKSITNKETLRQIFSKWESQAIRNTRLDDEVLVRRLRETAFLNGGLKIVFENKRTGRKETFQYQGGISDYVEFLASGRSNPYPVKPIFFENKSGKIWVQAAIQYTEEDEETILTFANNINTADGGTHLAGFKTAITRVVNQFGRSTGALKEKDSNLSGDDIREGITAIVSIRLPQPQFEGQTKGKLGSPEVEGVVNRLVGEALTEYFEKNPAIVKMIVERAFIAQKAREAAKKQSELIKRKSLFGKSNRLPGKLKDCDSENRDETELFIVEGDSAAGPAKDGRDPRAQAILPIRGKIINAEKHDLVNLLKNTEIQALISAIGAGVTIRTDEGDSDFTLENRRYNKVILMTDADVDGSHIATLLLTFLYRFMRPLVTEGHVYLAQPPLYKVDNNKQKIYCWSLEERNDAIQQLGPRAKITRFKGLGEMNAEELAETTMDKSTRRLIRVNVPNTGDADQMLSVLMGRNIAARKAHIVKESQRRTDRAIEATNV
jgi:DNA gyrase subunit B